MRAREYAIFKVIDNKWQCQSEYWDEDQLDYVRERLTWRRTNFPTRRYAIFSRKKAGEWKRTMD